MKYTKEQIREILSLGYEHTESLELRETWLEFAETWFQDDISDYLEGGFQGYDERSVEQIILDFFWNDKLDGTLTDEEVNELNKKCN